jgi:hypothetical protein
MRVFHSVLAAALLCSAANATILTFKITNAPVGAPVLSNGFSIPDYYGDNVSTDMESNLSRTVYYEMGNAWTPLITADWATRSILAPTTKLDGKTVGIFTDIGNWGATSHSATIDDPGNYFAELVLTAAAGKHVQLNSFQLRSRTGDTDSRFSINDVFTPVTVPGSTWYAFAGPVKAETITLRWGFDTSLQNIAIDNVNFDEVSAAVAPPTPDPGTETPEPATMLVAGSALVGLALYGRRRK